uniref:AIG1-type G domain-containing protein n=1 Tax=Hucho hucho TaxID=62062 RepID=A0A4W5PPN3_9TELE
YPTEQNKEVQIVLVGKTTSGNTKPGCKREVGGKCVAVIDTPGLFGTKLKQEEAMTEISQCIALSAPGPHVFLVVIKLGRFTQEEQKTVVLIQILFGDEASKYIMVLFTHGESLDDDDDVVTIEDYLREDPHLQCLIAKCNRQYHVFNNKDNNPLHVTELLDKINKMVMKNGGSHYIMEKFQEAERAMEEEKNRILRENEEKIHREEEKLKMKNKAWEEAIKEEKKRVLKEVWYGL